MGPLRKLSRVKRWYYLVLGGILVAGAVYIYLHRVDLGLTSPSVDLASPDQSLRPANIAWTKVDRSPEGFALEMPEETKEIQVPAYNGQGTADQVSMIYSYPDSSTSYSISWADNPPVMQAANGNVQQTLDSARDAALARTQTVLVSETQSVRQGYPVRDFVGRNQGGGIFNARLILAGRRLYLLMAAFSGASARNDADVNHFFDSFRVVEAAK